MYRNRIDEDDTMCKDFIISMISYTCIILLVGFGLGVFWCSYDVSQTICSSTQTQTTDYLTCKSMNMYDMFKQIPTFRIQKNK